MDENGMDRNQRVRKLACRGGALALILAGYYLFVRITGLVVPCVFHEVTGLFCPGCGITRMFLAIGRLDFPAAFRWNPGVLVLLPFAAADAVWCAFLYIRHGKIQSRIHNVFVWVVLVLLLVFAPARNVVRFI